MDGWPHSTTLTGGSFTTDSSPLPTPRISLPPTPTFPYSTFSSRTSEASPSDRSSIAPISLSFGVDLWSSLVQGSRAMPSSALAATSGQADIASSARHRTRGSEWPSADCTFPRQREPDSIPVCSAALSWPHKSPMAPKPTPVAGVAASDHPSVFSWRLSNDSKFFAAAQCIFWGHQQFDQALLI